MGSPNSEPGAETVPFIFASATGRGRRRRWLWIGLGAACLALAVLGLLMAEAAVYQPITWGDMGGPFPSLPTGVGVKVVNNFGPPGGDYYVPPQRGVFSFGVTIYNSGSRPITVDAVDLYPPSSSGFRPVRLAGPVLYTTDLGTVGITPHVHALRHLRIAPGETIFVGIPLRTWPCGQTGGWITDPTFYVREHFLFFSHLVALPWSSDGAKLIMHSIGGTPGEAYTICAPS